MIVTSEKAGVIGWLLNYWRDRGRAARLAMEYQEWFAERPLIAADLARFCNVFDSSLDESRDRTMANEGRREVWLHIQEMTGLDPVDLQNLKEETEK